MDFEGIKLSEINQRKNPNDLTYIWNSKTKKEFKKEEKIQQKNK